MDSTFYTTISRQSGLMKEMQSVANNIANAATTGYREEGVIFSEFVRQLEGSHDSLSMAYGNVRNTNFLQGGMDQTGGDFDLALEGDGFFMIETPGGNRLTRAGVFFPNEVGELVNPDGHRLLDLGEAPIFIPPDAQSITVGQDGTLSVNGVQQTQIGLFMPEDSNQMMREDGVRFRVEGNVVEAENVNVLQGFLEAANVDPVSQITRMIEVQRSYEMGQAFMDKEEERLRGLMETLGR